MKNRLLSWLLAAAMVLSCIPMGAFAAQTPDQVHVIVENQTCSTSSAAAWGDTPAGDRWTGVRVDAQVELEPGDTAGSAAIRAITDAGLAYEGTANYISAIDGLGPAGSGGWMGTLNGWFTNAGLGSFAVADGDIVRMMYSVTGGPDVGGSGSSNDKGLVSLTPSAGTLKPAFSKTVHEYTLELSGDSAETLTLDPVPANRNFQCRVYEGSTYDASASGLRPQDSVTLAPGDAVTIVVGEPAWPSMNNGEYGSGAEEVPAGVYTITAAAPGTEPEAGGFDSFFAALDGYATVENDTDKPFIVDEAKSALVTDIAGVRYGETQLTLTFSKAAELSFDYQCSTEQSSWSDTIYDKFLVRLDGEQKLLDGGVQTAFQSYSLKVPADGVVTLAYEKDSGGDEDGDCVWLKNFAVSPLATVTFPNLPAGAAVEVKQGGKVIPANADGASWTLTAGDYTFSASCFGYDSVSDVAFTVGAQDLALEQTLVQLPSGDYTFVLTPDTAELTVTQGETNILPNDGVYSLPVSTEAYTYEISAVGYITLTGEITVSAAESKTLTLALQKGAGWDGTASEPAKSGEVYQIGTAAELAWFAQQVNAGQTGLNGELTADITLSDPEAFNLNWTPIGNKDNPYQGRFNGAGHKVTGLYIHQAPKADKQQGLFGVIGTDGAVRNVILEGVSIDSESTVGGIAGENRGLISCCFTESGLLKSGGGHVAGGIVGENIDGGTVELCANRAGIQNPDSMSGDYAAGIAGENHGAILDCYNVGTVTAYKSAGIAGWGSSYDDAVITNCWNGGTLVSTSRWNIYHVSSYGDRTNCYYINTNDTSNTDSYSTAVKPEEVAALAARLGSAFENTADGTLRLLCENPEATYTIRLTVTPAEAEVTLQKGGEAVTGTQENGVHTFSGLQAGTYTYTVSHEAGDFAPQTGELVLNGRNAAETVELAVRRYDVVFTLTPKDTLLTLKAGDTVIEGVRDAEAGTVTYSLPNGEYTYAYEKFGYVPGTGALTVDRAGRSRTITMEQADGANITFAVTAPAGKTFYEGDPRISLTTGSHTETAVSGTPLYLPSGEYTYVIEAATFVKIEGSLTIGTEDQTVTREMVYSSAWDGRTAVEPALSEDVYQIRSGYELAWFRDFVNAKTESGSYCNARAILLEDIDLGNQPWTPIGHDNYTGYGTPNCGYTGDFNGNHKTITGLNVQMAGGKRAGLFGSVVESTYGDGRGAGCVHDLTVEGTVAAKQYLGGVAGLAADGASVTGCTSGVTLTAEDGYVGGIVGQLRDGGTVTDCVNLGAISAVRTAGGIVGDASSASPVENCRSEGTVTGTGEGIGGIVGNNYYTEIRSCVNAGAITSADSRVGGIAGFTNAVISGCYNTGAVSGKSEVNSRGNANGVGGIAGILNYTDSGAKNCYNAGTVTDLEGGAGAVGAIAGNKSENGIAVENCHYLDTSCAQGMGGSKHDDADGLTPHTDAEMKEMNLAAVLGGRFAASDSSGYPILAFESEAPRFVTAFAVTPEDASVTVTLDSANVPESEHHAFVLTSGQTYSYRVEKENFNTVEGSVTAAEQSVLLEITMTEETFPVTVKVTPADAKLTVTDSENTVFAPGTDGYSLPRGSYTLRAEKFGYLPQEVTFTVTGTPVTLDPITLESAAAYAVTLNITYESTAPADPVIRVYSGEEQVGESASLSLPDGEYTYQIIASGYFNGEGSFTVSGKALTVDIPMALRTTWDGTASEPAVLQGVYQITCAEELAWFANSIGDGTIPASSDAILLADIYINDEVSRNSWPGIGSYSKQYAGTFDGNGKAVRGLDAPLFGYGGEGGLIKNVTVYGAVTGDSNRGGVCTASYGSFEHCVNHASVAATGQRVGGIVGVLYSTGSIKNCLNYGDISTTKTAPNYGGDHAYIGGVAGYAYGNVEGCANYGSVTSANKTNGGIGGVVGETMNGVTVQNCYNMGAVLGCTGTGGVVGMSTDPGSKIVNCYNAGEVRATDEYPRPHVGAVVGNVSNSDGGTVGTVTNCYYLENSYYHDSHGTILNGGIGYGTGEATVLTEAEMKVPAFVLSLGEGYNADALPNINGGYPVLRWQGGKAPVSDEDVRAVAADKLALTVTPDVIREAMTLTLAASGENGSAITWKSDKPAVITDAGAVNLPAEGTEAVTLTATLSKGSATDTKTFTVNVQSAAATTGQELAALGSSLETQLTLLKPVFGTDTNLNTLAKAKIVPQLSADNLFVTADKLTVTVESTGTNGTPNDAQSHIASDGALTYYYSDPATSTMKVGIVNDVKLKLTVDGQSILHTVRVQLPWDAELVRQAMQPIADALTFDAIRGANTAADKVTENLTLPVVPENYGWASIGWTSSSNVVRVQPNQTFRQPSTGLLVPAEEDTAAVLTATVTFNKTSDGEPDITLQKQIPITVQGRVSTVRAELQAALDKYTLDKLTDSVTGNAIDPIAVTGDIQLLTPRNLGIDGGRISVTASTDSTNGEVNGYRLNIFRPLPGESAETIELTVTLKHKQTEITQSKVIGTITVQPLEQSDIDAELMLMEQVKAHYFDGIRSANTDKNDITSDLHAFQEAHRDTPGGLVWVYDRRDRTGRGIVPTDIPKEGYDESYNLFHSTVPGVIAHETLRVHPAADITEVTITSCLGSETFRGYAAKYPGNADLQKLENQMVSVTVYVRGTTPDAAAMAAKKLIAELAEPVTEDSGDALKAARSAYDALTPAQQAQVDNLPRLENQEQAYAELIMQLKTEAARDISAHLRKLLADGRYSEDDEQRLEDILHNAVDLLSQAKTPEAIRRIRTWALDAMDEVKPIEAIVPVGPKPSEPAEPDKPEEPEKPIAPEFADVRPNDWFYDDVRFVTAGGLFNGVDALHFDPDGQMTRAMLAAVLYRHAGSPAVLGQPLFSDTAEGSWYADAVSWAGSSGILQGYGDGRFGPDDPVTREQIVTVLYRYSKQTEAGLALDGFADAASVSDYARDAMGWGVKTGLITGRDGNLLAPKATATRAEVAAMLHRFLEK